VLRVPEDELRLQKSDLAALIPIIERLSNQDNTNLIQWLLSGEMGDRLYYFRRLDQNNINNEVKKKDSKPILAAKRRLCTFLEELEDLQGCPRKSSVVQLISAQAHRVWISSFLHFVLFLCVFILIILILSLYSVILQVASLRF
jgi:hypothetical protein